MGCCPPHMACSAWAAAPALGRAVGVGHWAWLPSLWGAGSLPSESVCSGFVNMLLQSQVPSWQKKYFLFCCWSQPCAFSDLFRRKDSRKDCPPSPPLSLLHGQWSWRPGHLLWGLCAWHGPCWPRARFHLV